MGIIEVPENRNKIKLTSLQGLRWKIYRSMKKGDTSRCPPGGAPLGRSLRIDLLKN